MRRLRLVVVALFLGVAMLASPLKVLAQSKQSCAQPLIEWTIEKLELVDGKPMLFVNGSNKQNISYVCKKYEIADKTDPKKTYQIDEVDGIKYHFWHEEGYELCEHVFSSRTFNEGLKAIVLERYSNKPIDIKANILSIAFRECDNRKQEGVHALVSTDFTKDHCLDPQLLAKVIARLGIISDFDLVLESPVMEDWFGAPPDCAHAKIVVVNKTTGVRYPVVLRSDNNPTVQFVE